jgi:N-dimethylarginine dimethylaminohydrolase
MLGKEFIVGLSSRTNDKGVKELENAFRGINVIKCHLKEGLHLKCFLTMIARDTILIGISECAKYLRNQIEQQSMYLNSYKYDFYCFKQN